MTVTHLYKLAVEGLKLLPNVSTSRNVTNVPTPTYVNLPISNFKILNNILFQSSAKSLPTLRNEDAKFCSEDVCSTVHLLIFSHWGGGYKQVTQAMTALLKQNKYHLLTYRADSGEINFSAMVLSVTIF
jgi:hypothetical protein